MPRGLSSTPSEKRKLTLAQARQLRARRKKSPKKWTIERLAAEYVISPSSVAYIIGGMHYRLPELELDEDEV